MKKTSKATISRPKLGDSWVKQWKKLSNAIIPVTGGSHQKVEAQIGNRRRTYPAYFPMYASARPETFYVHSGAISGNIEGNSARIQLGVLPPEAWCTIISILAQQAWIEFIFYQPSLYEQSSFLLRYKTVLKNTPPFQIAENSLESFYSSIPLQKIPRIDQLIAEQEISILPSSLSPFQITCSCMNDKTQDASNYCSHVKQLFVMAENYFA